MKVKILFAIAFAGVFFATSCKKDDTKTSNPSSWKTDVSKVDASTSTWKDVSNALKAVDERQASATEKVYSK